MKSGPPMLAGELISGKYRLLRLLGSGGMGSVWAARNELTQRDFAIKFLLPELANNQEALQRFFHEARACGQIRHQAVVDVFDIGQTENGTPYLVMELLEGEGLDQRLTRIGPLRPAEAAAWVSFIARGLEEAHKRGLVHRDIKPGNIFFSANERGELAPKLLDFGVSKAVGRVWEDEFVKTMTGAVLGSPSYMSPEQARGDLDVDARADIWSLGVILYEALIGRPPFDAPNYNALMVAIITQPHESLRDLDPSIPRDLSELVDNILMKDREKRIKSARELADLLDEIVSRITATPYPSAKPADQQITNKLRAASFDTTQGTWSDGRRRSRAGANPVVWMGAGILSVALVGIGVFAYVQARPPLAAVAGRATMALSNSQNRLAIELKKLQEESTDAPDVEPADKPGLTLEPDDLPPADLPSKPTAPPKTYVGPKAAPPPPPSNPPKAPHGGVDSAGF